MKACGANRSYGESCPCCTLSRKTRYGKDRRQEGERVVRRGLAKRARLNARLEIMEIIAEGE